MYFILATDGTVESRLLAKVLSRFNKYADEKFTRVVHYPDCDTGIDLFLIESFDTDREHRIFEAIFRAMHLLSRNGFSPHLAESGSSNVLQQVKELTPERIHSLVRSVATFYMLSAHKG
jgi:hypothetical protein